MTFGDRLHSALQARGNLCVGVDPHPALLDAWGLPDNPPGLEFFALTVVEAVGPHVPVLKPQSAFFERHGAQGVAALERTIAAARTTGALVLLDVKRADIGSTVQAYADAYLDPSSPVSADAITAVPYLGFESLRPLLDTAAAHDRGVFIVTMTSNPEGPEVQQSRVADGRTVAGAMLDHVRRANQGAVPLGSVGCVIGATIAPTSEDLDVGGPLLAPGVGAQGGMMGDLPGIFGAALPRVLPAMSRQILSAGPDQKALKSAATRAIGEFTLLLGAQTR